MCLLSIHQPIRIKLTPVSILLCSTALLQSICHATSPYQPQILAITSRLWVEGLRLTLSVFFYMIAIKQRDPNLQFISISSLQLSE